MNIEEYKKLAKNKIEADTLTQKVRDVIKITKWEKQDMREGFKETFNPLIESQDSIKKSIDEQQNATIEQLKKNQLALTDKEKRLEAITSNLLAIMSSGKDGKDGDGDGDGDGDDDDGDGDGDDDDDDDDLLSSSDEEEKFKEKLPPTPEKKLEKKVDIQPEYFDEYLNNKQSIDVLKKIGYDKLPSFYFDKDITILASVIDSVSNKFNKYMNITLKNTANFHQYPNSGFIEAFPLNENPRKETIKNISDFNILSSYLTQLNKLNIFKMKTGYGMIYFQNPNHLLKRLELLGGSILAGNNGVINEFSKIAHLLNQMKVITKKQLNELLKTYITNR